MGIFIQVTLDSAQITPETGNRLVRVCPVDIFALDGDALTIRPNQEDECTLCRLCLDAAPPGAVRIHKTYSGETLVK